MTRRAVVSVSSRCVPGPAPRARDALEGPLLSAASPRATYSRSSSSRPRVAVLTSRRTPPNPPADGRFLPAQRKSPSPRCVACEPGAFGRPSPAATRALSAASSSLAGWILYVAALTVVSARGGFVLPRAQHAPREAGRGNSQASTGREHWCQWGQVSSDGNGGEFSQPQNLTGSPVRWPFARLTATCGRVRDFFPNTQLAARVVV